MGVYLRSNQHFSLRRNPIQTEDLSDSFVAYHLINLIAVKKLPAFRSIRHIRKLSVETKRILIFNGAGDKGSQLNQKLSSIDERDSGDWEKRCVSLRQQKRNSANNVQFACEQPNQHFMPIRRKAIESQCLQNLEELMVCSPCGVDFCRIQLRHKLI